MAPSNIDTTVIIGILALQGAFAEHQTAIQQLALPRKVDVLLVRTADELARCKALIIPGGESTTIALLARLSGLLDPLREFIKVKPVWGTCAGAILLAKSVHGAKRGGQELLGGMSITIARNGWGSQVESFEADLEVTGMKDPGRPFTGVFIRAPVVLTLEPAPEDPPIQVISRLSPSLLPCSLTSSNSTNEPRTFVALRQGLHFLTTFHPELTRDNRFHEYFVRECVIPSISTPRP
ncbi:SNO glutamine amidotransferase [Macrolepiota fuliginosa MF-IS2]|uniref:glutaminase n=1 Tax=Macrolepiota fuliginosa MF-IS2 TaxID=1400762 RepID=A0A9P6C4Q2_9AGAR|nr:SNO glutamine amidotransferase [Macrolepiota fuliginosa MF-IS2]